jgi:protein-tyrosine phosphatase
VTFRVLMVCTANICRSPMAEAMLRRRLDGGVTVASAGVYGHDGSPMAPGSVAALAALGIADDGHRGRLLTPAMVGDADLVLTMEESHREAILTRSPEARPRTFALREFARLAGGEERMAGADLDSRARALVGHAARRRTVLPWPGVDDVPDPYGGPEPGYHACAALLHAEIGTLTRPLLSV